MLSLKVNNNFWRGLTCNLFFYFHNTKQASNNRGSGAYFIIERNNMLRGGNFLRGTTRFFSVKHSQIFAKRSYTGFATSSSSITGPIFSLSSYSGSIVFESPNAIKRWNRITNNRTRISDDSLMNVAYSDDDG
jgi:hypothetical protein